MSEIQQQIEQAREEIEKCRGAVEQRNRLLRLTQNVDFRDLITQGFLKDECARYTHMSTDINIPLESRTDALGYAQSAGYFKRWINFVIIMGNTAENNIKDLEEFLEDARAIDHDDAHELSTFELTGEEGAE